MTAHETRGAQGRPAGGTAGRAGIFFCRCGPNLGQVVRIDELADPAAWPAAHDVVTHPTCAAACPTGAASARHFTRAQIEAEISALLLDGGTLGPALASPGKIGGGER